MTRDLRSLLATVWSSDRLGSAKQIAALLVTGVIGGASLLLLVPIVNTVANPESSITVPVVGTIDASGMPLWALVGLFVALSAVQALNTRYSTLRMVRLRQEIVDRLREDAFQAVLEAKWEFILQRRKSDIVEIVTTGAIRSGSAFQLLLQASASAVLALSSAAVALIVAPGVAAIAIVAVSLWGVAQVSTTRRSHQLGRLFGEKNRHVQAVVTDSMDSLRLVRAHNASKVWSSKLSGAFGDARDVQVANARRASTVAAVSSVGLAAAAGSLVLISVYAGVSPPLIVVILLVVARMAAQVQSVASNAMAVANLLPAVGDLTALTQQAREAVEAPHAVWTGRDFGFDADVGSPLVEFSDVTYRYPDSSAGIEGVTFVVPRGQITALTGPSGAGKSTVADLALGLLSPSRGDLRVSGAPVGPQDLPRWRRHVAYVPQDPALIPGSLRDNLTWSVEGGATDEQCWTALDRAAAGFAHDLPEGLDTVLGDRGIRLSGGERQRIAIARALLRNPRLLVLDEATSALDDATEAEILALVATLTPEVTVLVIAHRRSTIQGADHVVRLQSLATSEKPS